MKLLSLLLLLFLIGCHFPADVAIDGRGGRNSYNIAVQRTNAEEMLLNLVRLRYFDSPYFLKVSSVTSQFTIRNSASAEFQIPGFTRANPVTLGGSTEWINQPTLQYSPLEGYEFAAQLMSPLNISTLQELIYSGWEIDLIFQLTVQDFKHFHNIPKGKVEDKLIDKYYTFYEMIFLLAQLQKAGHLQVGIKKIQENGEIQEVFQLAFPEDVEFGEQVAQLANDLTSINGKYIINIVQGFDAEGNVGLLTRSLLSCMYYLSHSVSVPEEDVVNEKVEKFACRFESKKLEDICKELIDVHFSYVKPIDSYLYVNYRDKWFYIKDNDIGSKKTFMLLLELYNLQAKTPANAGPVLTLPIGN